jgi:hypothetical protein
MTNSCAAALNKNVANIAVVRETWKLDIVDA